MHVLVQVRVFQSPTLVVELPLVPIIQEGVDHATTWKREASNTNPQDSLAQPLPSPQHTMLRRLQHLPVSFLLQSVSEGGTRYIFSLLLYLAGLSTRVSVRI